MNLKVLYLSLQRQHLCRLFAALPLLHQRDRYAPLNAQDKQLIFTTLLRPLPPSLPALSACAETPTLPSMIPPMPQQPPHLYLDCPCTVHFFMTLMPDTVAVHQAFIQLQLPQDPAALLTVAQQIIVAQYLHCPYVCRSRDGTCLVIAGPVSVQALIDDFTQTVNPNLRQQSLQNIHAALTQLHLPQDPVALLTVAQQIALALCLHTPYVLTRAAQAAASA